MHYCTLENFCVSQQLNNDLAGLPWQSLELASAYTRSDWLRQAYQRGILLQSLGAYGWIMQDVGTLLSYSIPPGVEHKIRNELQQRYGSEFSAAASIRLQIIHGGSIIPIHTDLNREASIVMPISHRRPSITAFYKCVNHEVRGMMPPDICEYTGGVSADVYPVLLQVNVPHAVVYSRGAYTQNSPRISLSLKFQNLDFDAVRTMIG
jgi:hypothetical protein